MSAAEHLAEAIDVGCSRDDHDHVGDHRREVLMEAADAVDSGKAPFPEGVKSGASWAARMLRRMADEEGKGTGTTGGEPTPAVDFFQVGTAYRSKAGPFQCHAVTHHPGTGERRALGWMFRQVDGVLQWAVTQLDPDDYAVGGWTETGGGR
ncbi:hypothetical protein ACFWNQ_24845 [Streptomyces virginiae]|uniref:hypothetical protein n=1 Tax=Streptomyces virginiae TaxID=1961 RepID=UPI00366882D9